MTITFSYIRDNRIGLKTDHGIKIEAYFDQTTLREIYIDGFEYSPTDDTLNGLFVAIDKQIVPMGDLVRAAEHQYPEIIADAEREERAERRHVESMVHSSRYV